MTRTTRAQRLALRAIFNRAPQHTGGAPMTYRQFRASVQPTFGMDGAVVVPWARMWLCIERDGYTHS